MPEQPLPAWRCVVCGYIHRGGEPLDECPLCGAGREDFEKYQESEPHPALPARRGWVCQVCGYIHEGDQPPDECPLCGVGPEGFEALVEQAAAENKPAKGLRVVILGGGVAAVSAAEAARRASPGADVLILSREAELPYYRLNLTRLLAGEVSPKDLLIHDQAWYDQAQISVQCGIEAEALDLDAEKLHLAGSKTVPFDRLVLATGAHAFVPPINGAQRGGVFTLRSLEDARAILAAGQPDMDCVCIGGGILGLETAGALARRGLKVTILEGFDYLMPRQLNRSAGKVLQSFIEKLGITVRTAAATREIAGRERVEAVLLEDGTRLPADLVVMAVGVRANTHLARKAGLAVNNGVLVDNLLRSSHPHVFAAGDVAEHQGMLYGSWAAAQQQGRAAGTNAVNPGIEFGGLPRSHTLKVLGLGMTSIGRFEPQDGSDHLVEAQAGDHYSRFVFRDERMVGAVLLGDVRLASSAVRAIDGKKNFARLLAAQPSAEQVAQALSQEVASQPAA